MSDNKFASEMWKCPEKCDQIYSIDHIANACPQYEQLRIGKDIHSNDNDLVKFFKEVIELRDEARNE